MKRLLWICASLVLIGAGCYRTAAPLPGPVSPSYETTTVESEDEQAIVLIEIPIIAGISDPQDSVINQHIYDLLTGSRDSFLESIEEPGEEDVKNSFTVAQEVMMLNQNVVSIRFAFTTYNTGAAHPSSWTDTFTYDVARAQEFEIDDMFDPDTGYRVDFWRFMQTELATRAERDALPELAEEIMGRALPDPDYFKPFTITQTHIQFYFDPYEIGPYAWGSQRVDVPWDEFREILRDDTVVRKVIE